MRSTYYNINYVLKIPFYFTKIKKWWLTRRYSNSSAPILQSRPRSFVRKLATFCRPLLDIKPVIANSLMLASTKGTPVRPSVITNDAYFQLHCTYTLFRDTTWFFNKEYFVSNEEKKWCKPFHALKSLMSFFHGTDFSWSPEIKSQWPLHSFIVCQKICWKLIELILPSIWNSLFPYLTPTYLK